MAIKIYEQFKPFANPADGDHPYGSFKNDSIPGAEDGTPLDAVWGNDMVGFTDALLNQAGITPSGLADTVNASQRVDAMNAMYQRSTLNYSTLRALKSESFKDGSVILVSGDCISGKFIVKTGSNADNGGTTIQFNDDSNRYAERIYDRSIGLSVDWFEPSGLGVLDDTIRLNVAYAAAGMNSIVNHNPKATYAVSASLLFFGGTKYNGNGCKIIPIIGLDPNVIQVRPLVASSVLNGNVDGVTVDGFVVDGERGGFDVGIWSIGGSGVRVTRNTVRNIGTKFGVHTLESGMGIEVIGIVGGAIVSDCDISDNIIQNIGGWGNARGDAIYSEYCTGISINRNKCKGAQRMGIALTSKVSDITITANRLVDIALSGIDLESNEKTFDLGEVAIVGNTIRNFAKKPAGQTGTQFNGIDIHDTANDIVISANIIMNGDPDSLGNTCVGILGMNSANSASITGNIIAGVDEGIKNFDGGAFTDFTLAGNILRDIRARGILLAIASDATITGNKVKSVGPCLFLSSAGTATVTGNSLTSSGPTSVQLNQDGDVILSVNNMKAGTQTGTQAIVNLSQDGGSKMEAIITNNIFSGEYGATNGLFAAVDTGGDCDVLLRDNMYIKGITQRAISFNAVRQYDNGGVQVYSPNGTGRSVITDDSGVVSSVTV